MIPFARTDRVWWSLRLAAPSEKGNQGVDRSSTDRDHLSNKLKNGQHFFTPQIKPWLVKGKPAKGRLQNVEDLPYWIYVRCGWTNPGTLESTSAIEGNGLEINDPILQKRRLSLFW